MTKQFACVFAVVSLALTGCGGSLCQDLADTSESLGEKAKACGATPSDPITEEEINQCEESLDSCTDSDKKALEDFISCLDELPTCSTANQSAFATSLLACIAKIENVSASCGDTSSGRIERQIARYGISR
jgi:hypothetical protein